MSYCVEKELYRSRNEVTVLSSGNEGYCAVPENPTSPPCFIAAYYIGIVKTHSIYN